jgi:hypothetical protein
VIWWTHSFDVLIFPQLPGFLTSSWLWGMPGFAHDTAQHVQLRPGGFLFPYLMVFVNGLFYGTLVHLSTSISKGRAADFDFQGYPAGQRSTAEDQRRFS